MRSDRVAGSAVMAAFLAIGLALAASGRSPIAEGQISLRGTGFSLVAEERGPGGSVIDTYRSARGAIRLIGRPGSSATVDELVDPVTGRRSVELQLSTTRPKTPADAGSYGRSGRSAVDDLVALGLSRDEAIRQFGDLGVMDRTGRVGVDTRRVAGLSARPPVRAPALAVSTTTPYDTQCASLNYDGGRIVGYGCSTLYLVAANGGDWWFNNKYKFSAHSTDGSIFRPQRVFEVGWGLAWSARNLVYDWEPSTTVNRNDCGNVSFSLFAMGAGISVNASVCPNRISPWNLSSVRSGALWQGVERGQDYEAAIGVQAVHSPPDAAASYSSPFKLVWGPFPP